MAVSIPGYKILRILGRGGMATVYLAIQEVFEREVALKVISKALAEDTNFGQRFFREAKIVSKLVHPNIVTVHDVGVHNGMCYLSMEYIDGKDLKHVVSRLSFREKIAVIRDIAKALDYSGSKGFVHRDIKPENIMFHSSDGRAVLMDFGIARAAESDTSVTQTGTAIGTPHYMSPEQAKGKTVDSRSDIYSLGVVFYYILVGKVPYDAESAVAIGIKHITEPVPVLPSHFSALQHVISRMMAKDVNKRYQNAKQLMTDLDQLDLDLLEHKARIVRDVAIAKKRAKSGEVPKLSHAEDENAEAFEDDDADITDIDAFADYEVEEGSRERPSILPWCIAGGFVVFVISGFLYFKHPEAVQPWIDNIAGGVKQEPVVPVTNATVPSTEPLPSDVAEPEQPSMLTVDAPLADEVVQEQQRKLEIARLENALVALRADYANDTQNLNELVGTYRKLLEIAPEEHPAYEAFDIFKRDAIRDVREKANRDGSSSTLDQRVVSLRNAFPGEQDALDAILQEAQTRKRVMTFILEAEAYLKQNNLTRPAGRNALDSYTQALKLDDGNEKALQGKKQISARLSTLASKRFDNGQLEPAARMLATALDIDPGNQAASELQKEMDSVLEKQRRVAWLLNSGNTKLDKGQLFLPENRGAFHDFQRVLKIEPDNSEAKQGIDLVVDALSAKLWQLVSDQQFVQANTLMQAALKDYGTNDRVRSLSLAVEEVIGDRDQVLEAQPPSKRVVVKGASG